MKKIGFLILMACLLGACSNENEDKDSSKQIEDVESVEDAKEVESAEDVEDAKEVESAKDAKEVESAKDAKEVKDALKVTTDKEYVEALKEEKEILDAQYSIMEGIGIAKLQLTVDEKVTLEKAKELAKAQEKKVLEEYPDFLPVVTIVQKGVELYSTLNEAEPSETKENVTDTKNKQ